MNPPLTFGDEAHLRILLVEDSPDDALLVREMLLAEGDLEVTTAPTLARAKRETASGAPHCILLDLALPDAEGTEAVRDLRRLAPATPIVVLTGLDDELQGLEAIRAGADEYLVKGQVGSHALRRHIRFAVEREQFASESAAAAPSATVERMPPAARFFARGGFAAVALVTAGLAAALQLAGVALEAVHVFDLALLAVLSVALATQSLRLRRRAKQRVPDIQQLETAILTISLPDWTVNSWNCGAARLFGYEADEVLGEGIELFLPDDLRAEAQAARDAVAAGEPVSLDTRRLHRDGRELDVALRMSPMRDSAGDVVGASAVVVDIGEKAAAMRALRRAEQRFRGAFAHAPAGMAVVSLEPENYGRLLQVNPTLCELTGYPEAALLATDFLTLTHPEDREEEVAMIEALVRGDCDSCHLEKRLVRLDGDATWVQLSASLIRDERGRPLYGLGQVQDISARRRAEEVRSRLAAIVDSSTDAIFATDRHGVISAWNPGAEALLGYHAKDVIGRHLSMLTPSELGESEPAVSTDAAPGPCSSTHDTRMLKCDGGIIEVSLSASSIRDQDGQLTGMSHIARDITAEKAAAAALRASEERLRQIVETANEGIWALDADGRTTFANQKLARILGTTVRDLEGASVFDFVDESDRTRTARHLNRRQEGAPEQFELQFARPDGAEASGLVSVSVLHDSQGNPGGALAMVADVTERLAAQRERQEMERKLEQWQRLESLGQLAGGVAHDMNNLLGVILNFSDFGLDSVAGGAGEEELTEIRGAAERAAKLTRQLLLFARREVARPEIVDLNALLDDAEKLLRRTIGEHITLVTRHSPSLPTVKADPGLVEQVLINLVVNARDAMPDGGEVKVATDVVHLSDDELGPHRELQSGQYVCLSVADEGHGMSEEVAARAFDPFFTTKPYGSGTGLGLATVYGIVTKAGGRVQLYSEVGGGTVVKVYLPVSGAGVAAPVKPPDPPTAAGDQGSVLVVEDDTGLRRVTVRILEEHGYRVLTADHPTEALELACRNPDQVDVLVTDVVMPELTGPQLARRLQEIQPELPVVFVSGYTDRPDELPEGANFLSKPFSRADLLREVAAALARPEDATLTQHRAGGEYAWR